jgi:hypothetical protein
MTLPPGFETTFPQEKEIDVLIVPPPAHPMAVARAFVADRYTDDDSALLLR